MAEIADLLHHHCASDEDCAWGECKSCSHLEECSKLPPMPKDEGKELDAPECPKGQKKKGCIPCKFYNWCPNSGDPPERREFQSFGAGCCGFSEEKMLCRNPDGIFCTLKKRQEYRCPIRHDGEPPANPSWEEMQDRKKKGLHPRTGLKQKITQCEVGPRHWCDDECPVEHCTAQYSYAGCHEKEATAIPPPEQETPAERLARGKALREEVLEYRETMKRMSTGRSSQKEKKSPRALTQKEKPAEPEKATAPEKKKKKPAADVPALNVLYLEDCESLTKRMEPESIDLVFTDPPYVTEPIDDDGVTQWERAYVALHLIASKVLKPSGFLITYAPQAHLQDIMEILAYGSSRKIMVNESGGQLDYFWIIPSLNAGATCKAHKWNALCLHKPILVYQKAPFKSPSKCFADVIRGKKQKSYHAWQQSVHDVLGILSRFMEPGQVVYDPYACTATTLIAGQLLGMQYIGAEIDPKAHAIGVRELQQRPMDLFTFGGEKPEAPCDREPEEVPKDTSRQAAFDPKITKGIETGKLLAAIEASLKETRPVELHAACLECEAVDRCMRHDPRANCLQEFLDFEKAVEEGREEDKIPNITWCSTIRNCPSVDWEGGICTKTGNLVKDQTYCPTQHLINEERKWKAATSPLFVRWCGNCGHHKARKTFHESCPRLPDLMFKGGKLSANQLMNETACEKKCDHWFPKEEKKKESTQDPSEKKVKTHYYSGKDLSPSLGTCPDKCAYKDAEKSSCRFMDQQFPRMESCPTGVLQGDEAGQKCQLENIARALARLSAHLPSKERCQCNPCPDGVQRCGVSDEDCPFSKNSFEDLALCPMQNPRRVRQIRREHPVKFVNIKETQEDQSAPEKKPRSSKRTKALVAKASECHDPLRKFLNEHYEQITTGKDLPIVPHVVEQYKRFDDQERRVKLFIGTSTSPGQWWTLSPSGKLRKVSKRTGEHCQGEAFPDCKFSFEWHYDNKKED